MCQIFWGVVGQESWVGGSEGREGSLFYLGKKSMSELYVVELLGQFGTTTPGYLWGYPLVARSRGVQKKQCQAMPTSRVSRQAASEALLQALAV